LRQPKSARSAGSCWPISACIITYNEASRIGDCLASLEFCDERLVVDSFSQDGTQDRARNGGARVIERRWAGHIAQKEFASRAARHEWVLCLDADERVSDALREEILERRSAGFGDAAGYRMPRLSQYRGAWIRHGSWYPNRQLRLFDRRRGHWGGVNPHDRVIVEGPVAGLKNDLLHIPYRTTAEQLQTIDEYTAIAAGELLKAGCSLAGLRMIVNPPFRVVRSLILKRGFLDGRRGVALALMEARYARLKYARLLALQRQVRAEEVAGRFVALGSKLQEEP
jgi:hypothetical protein